MWSLKAMRRQQQSIFQSLQVSENKYRLLTENSTDMIARYSPDGCFLYVSPSCRKLFGYEPDDLLGHRVFEFFHPDDMDFMMVFHQEILNSDNPVSCVYRIRHKNGSYVWAETIGRTIKDEKSSCVLEIQASSRDVTDRKTAEQNLHRQKELLRVTLQSIGDGVIATDMQGKITGMNSVAEQLTGWPEQAAVGKGLMEVFSIFNEITGVANSNPVETVISTGKTIELANHTVLKARDGIIRPIADSAAPILDQENHMIGAVLVFRDTTEARKKEVEITYLSYHDVLTGLYNRTFYEEEVQRLNSDLQLPQSVIMGDINGLKLVNDVYGHAEGDKLLIVMAQVLRDCCRAEDIIARVGGDEFCILLPNADSQAAQIICNRIHQTCAAREKHSGISTGKINISLGYATRLHSNTDIQGVIKAAEDSMYKNKLMESKDVQAQIVTSIRETMFERIHETREHVRRVAKLSHELGVALGLTDEQLEELELAAQLHDIGMVAIDRDILNRRDPLTKQEEEEYKRHPEIGSRIAKASHDFAHVSDVILSHHENWDGSGYPQGLDCERIPLLSRIISIVESFDARMQGRSVESPLSNDEELLEMANGAGVQFDPAIIKAFVALLQKTSLNYNDNE
jgi:diguanylate cyclase (GGDEF)-like protein/PAS domain S-box-containing protein